MAKRKQKEFKCIMEFSEGADIRITEAFVDLYYDIKAGRVKGPPLLEDIETEEKPA